MAKRAKVRGPKKPAGRSKGLIVDPHFTLRLMGIVGVTRAHHMLGVSTSLLHKARDNGVVSKVVEVAAKGVMADLTNQAPNEEVALRAIAKKRLQADMQKEAREARSIVKPAKPATAVQATHPGALPPAGSQVVDLPPDKAAMLEAFVQALGGTIARH